MHTKWAQTIPDEEVHTIWNEGVHNISLCDSSMYQFMTHVYVYNRYIHTKWAQTISDEEVHTI